MKVKLSTKIRETITSAQAKAVGSLGADGVNVVPVSMAHVHEDSIWLFDFFFDKTSANIKKNPAVSFTCWSGMVGVQIKADVEYITKGEDFDKAVLWVRNQNPSRVVKGLLILRPTNIFDISPGGYFSAEDLKLS